MRAKLEKLADSFCVHQLYCDYDLFSFQVNLCGVRICEFI